MDLDLALLNPPRERQAQGCRQGGKKGALGCGRAVRDGAQVLCVRWGEGQQDGKGEGSGEMVVARYWHMSIPAGWDVFHLMQYELPSTQF